MAQEYCTSKEALPEISKAIHTLINDQIIGDLPFKKVMKVYRTLIHAKSMIEVRDRIDPWKKEYKVWYFIGLVENLANWIEE